MQGQVQSYSSTMQPQSFCMGALEKRTAPEMQWLGLRLPHRAGPIKVRFRGRPECSLHPPACPVMADFCVQSQRQPKLQQCSEQGRWPGWSQSSIKVEYEYLSMAGDNGSIRVFALNNTPGFAVKEDLDSRTLIAGFS